MKFRIYLFFFLLLSTDAVADQLYEFKKIDCMDGIQTFQMRDLKVWNIGHFGIWGKGKRVWYKTWDEHTKALKELEDKHGLYIFNQQYGWHDGKTSISWKLDNGYNQLIIMISYISYNRVNDTPIGPGEPLRLNPIISVLHSKYGLIYKQSALRINNFTVVNEYNAVQIEECRNGSCKKGRYSIDDFRKKPKLPLTIW